VAWDIKPFVGVAPVSFFMTPAQVAAAANLGPARARQDGPYLNEFRGINAPVFNYLDGGLVIVSTNRYLPDVLWNQMDIYKSNPIDVLRAMQKANGPALRIFDTVVFAKLGLQLTGFYAFARNEAYDPSSDDPDNRTLSAWAQVAQDRNLKELAAHTQDAPTF